MAGLGFPTTHWTLIVRAQSDLDQKRQAIDEIAAAYRMPLVRYARARGMGTERAEDLVHSLFVNLLSRDFVQRLDRERGRLRGFLKTALDHEIGDEIERAKATRRGGGQSAESIDALDESRQPAGGERPDEIFERAWALAVADRAMARLRAEARAGRTHERWPVIERFLTDDASMSYADAATLARITITQFKVSLHRARARFAELLREEAGLTVQEGDVAAGDDEARSVRTRLVA